MAKNKNIALITGVTGKDVAYIEELLLKRDYELEAGNDYKFTISAKF